MKKLLLLLLLSFNSVGFASDNGIPEPYFDDYLTFKSDYYKGEYKAAFEGFLTLAYKGDGNAAYYLWWLYKNGDGVKADKELAEQWKQAAIRDLNTYAELGNHEAQFNLADLYSVDGDKELAEKWGKKAFSGLLLQANQGDSNAQDVLSYLLIRDDLGVKTDDSQSAAWERKAAEKGNANSQYWLGQRLANYKELTRDNEEAIFWYTKAAKQGHLFAQDELEGVGLNVGSADRAFETSSNDSSQLLQYKETLEDSRGLDEKHIGKWYIGSNCDNVSSELLVLHDQVLVRKYSTNNSLINDRPFPYLSLSASGSLFFFRDNIILSLDSSSDIHDYYFEAIKFPELSSNSGYQTTKLLSCSNLSNSIDYVLLESDAIEFDKWVYLGKRLCSNNDIIDCLELYIDFADVSNNGELSRAELTRFARFLVNWLTLKGEVEPNERMGAAAVSMLVAPALAELILRNYDYDNDDHIALSEITHDMVKSFNNSELRAKVIRNYIEIMEVLSKSKKGASRMLDDLL